MALLGTGRFYKFEKSRSFIHVAQVLVRDSQWPFEDGEPLRVTVDAEKGRVVVEKAKAAPRTKRS